MERTKKQGIQRKHSTNEICLFVKYLFKNIFKIFTHRTNTFRSVTTDGMESSTVRRIATSDQVLSYKASASCYIHSVVATATRYAVV